MIPHKKSHSQIGFFSSFEELLDPKHPLFILSNTINWQQFEVAFLPLYCANNGRPAKAIRLMVGLLILKHLRNISDESVVEQWAENSYYQYFCGEKYFVPGVPCEASELVHFRNRIGKDGMELIFKESIRINGDDAQEEKIKVDTTVQEKNITYPNDAKAHKKIIKKCLAIAQDECLPVRQSYTRTIKKLSVDQRFRNHPKNKGKAFKADRKIKTIAGRLVRELERNLSTDNIYQNTLELYRKVLAQKRSDKNKIYSLHEPDVYCISKGKEHKKYEFGNKVSICVTENTGVIVGALSFGNPYDGHTLPSVIEQYENIFGKAPKEITADRGYRGKARIDDTQINIPKPFTDKKMSKYKQDKCRMQFKRRAAIEPVIGHLKSDHRVARNFYKGIKGDSFNILLAASAFNFKRMINKWKKFFCVYFKNIFLPIKKLFEILNIILNPRKFSF